jgi:protein-tyrosine-phosphatase
LLIISFHSFVSNANLAKVFPLMKSILVVCLGNICRSPMAEGAVRKALDEAGLAHVAVDSAGTSGWHEGGPPDPRAVKAALMRIWTSLTSAPARSLMMTFTGSD